MEVRQILRGTDTSFAAACPVQKAESESTENARPAADRLELSRQWVEKAQEQSAQLRALLSQPADREKKGILDMLDEPGADEQELDALSKELDVQMKCLKIAMNIMKGKKVPPEDERYLMENDPNGYKIAMAMKAMVKEDKKECKSVLNDEDKRDGETSGTEEGAPVESSAVSSDGGDAE